MVSLSIIKTKIARIENSLSRLKEKQRVSFDEFKKDIDLQDIVLHNLQLAIQGCVDMASHIISDAGWAVPATLAELFDVLAEHKIISRELGEKLSKMAGFRNIIIHEYETIDFKKVYTILTKDREDIYLFLREIYVYAKL